MMAAGRPCGFRQASQLIFQFHTKNQKSITMVFKELMLALQHCVVTFEAKNWRALLPT